jgi:hypothetical protein
MSYILTRAPYGGRESAPDDRSRGWHVLLERGKRRRGIKRKREIK